VLRDPSGRISGCDPEQAECEFEGIEQAGPSKKKKQIINEKLRRIWERLVKCPNDDCTDDGHKGGRGPTINFKDVYCSMTPNGRTLGFGGMITGPLGGGAVTAENVYNWDTMENSFFFSKGPAVGNPSAGVNFFVGPALGLNKGNENYKFGSSTFSLGAASPAGLGGSVAISGNSPGPNDANGKFSAKSTVRAANPMNWSRPFTLTAGPAFSTPGPSASLSVTHYTKPIGTDVMEPPTMFDMFGILTRLPCH